MISQALPRRIRAFTLVEILVVVVIMIVIAAVLFPRIAGNSRTKDGKAATPTARAHDVECISNLRSCRQAIEVAKAGDDTKFPSSLAELKLPSEVTHCVVSKQEYVYNPQTGEVHCPYPGHTSY